MRAWAPEPTARRHRHILISTFPYIVRLSLNERRSRRPAHRLHGSIGASQLRQNLGLAGPPSPEEISRRVRFATETLLPAPSAPATASQSRSARVAKFPPATAGRQGPGFGATGSRQSSHATDAPGGVNVVRSD